MTITLNGISLPESPFTVAVIPARPDPANCTVKGEALHAAIARDPSAFEVSFVDGLGQLTHAEVRVRS